MAFSPLPFLAPLAGIAAAGPKHVLGEPRCGHPLAAFGQRPARIEAALWEILARDASAASCAWGRS